MSEHTPNLNAVRAGYAANRNSEDLVPIEDGMAEFDRWLYLLLAHTIRAEADAIEHSNNKLPGMTVGDAVRGLRLGARDAEDVVNG